MARTILLWHHGIPTLAGGEAVLDHFDWFIERSEAGPPLLIAFRVAERVDRLDLRVFEALRLADHRLLYLDYEGPVSGGRGLVERVASGECGKVVEELSQLEVTLSFGGGPERLWMGERLEGDRWLFRDRKGNTGA